MKLHFILVPPREIKSLLQSYQDRVISLYDKGVIGAPTRTCAELSGVQNRNVAIYTLGA